MDDWRMNTVVNLVPVLSLSHISKVFAGTVALDGVDLELHAGEVHALIGENGSGKSTLLRVAAGVHRPTSGAIAVDGAPREYARPADATADGIVLVTQEGSLMPDLSATENIFVGRLLRRAGTVQWGAMHERAAELLAQLGAHFDPRRIARTLAPDEQQLVEIARALSYDSRVVLLDEPTSSLDREETERLIAAIRRMAESGIAVVFISHRLPELFAAGDRFTVLRDGKLVGTRPRAEVTEEWLVRAMVGRELQRLAPPGRPAAAATPALEVRGVCDRRGRVDDVSFSVDPGEIVGLAGLVGAGRSELLETLVGLRGRGAGEVLLHGAPLHGGVADALRAGLVLVPEDRKRQGLLPVRSIHDNATLTLPVKGRRVLRRRGQEASAFGPWLQQLDVKYASQEQPIAGLSGGNQQKVLLARALVTQPRVLLLDEPTRGIDLGAKQRIYEEIIQLAASGMAIVVASSELPELLAICHRVHVLREGRMVAGFDHDEMSEEAIVGAATGASSHV
jgi:rhamnose transport system ATP-binding protein